MEAAAAASGLKPRCPIWSPRIVNAIAARVITVRPFSFPFFVRSESSSFEPKRHWRMKDPVPSFSHENRCLACYGYAIVNFRIQRKRNNAPTKCESHACNCEVQKRRSELRFSELAWIARVKCFFLETSRACNLIGRKPIAALAAVKHSTDLDINFDSFQTLADKAADASRHYAHPKSLAAVYNRSHQSPRYDTSQ